MEPGSGIEEADTTPPLPKEMCVHAVGPPTSAQGPATLFVTLVRALTP
jgi:hypothetical protein